MDHSPEVAAEVSALVSGWRSKAMNIVMSLLALITLPAVLLVVFSQGLGWPWITRGVGLAAFLVLLLAVWRRDWSLPRRAVMFFVAAYAITALQWTMSGLVGSGRIALMLLPILALILVGNRAGWVAVGVSVIMFGTFTALAGTGVLAGRLIVRENSTDPVFWLLQGVMWLAALVPIMVLLARFQALQTKIMIEECGARREVQAAMTERRRLENEITRISEDEQRRLGSELHDGLCQQLTAALLDCTALENHLSARGAQESAGMRRLRGLLEDCIGSAYDAAKGLCPVDLNPESLAPALQRLGRKVQQSAGIVCELREEGDTSALNPQATLHLYRIAQEAVNNAVKHARCHRIVLELQGSAEDCILRVMNDGQPAVAGAQGRPGGMGMQIMNYRAKTIGGTLWVEHPAGGGTAVNCRVPCGPQQPVPPENAVSKH